LPIPFAGDEEPVVNVPRGVESLESDSSEISGDDRACWAKWDPLEDRIRSLEAVEDLLGPRAHESAEVFLMDER
jgi:hypothetical protein